MGTHCFLIASSDMSRLRLTVCGDVTTSVMAPGSARTVRDNTLASAAVQTYLHDRSLSSRELPRPSFHLVRRLSSRKSSRKALPTKHKSMAGVLQGDRNIIIWRCGFGAARRNFTVEYFALLRRPPRHQHRF